MIEELQGDDLLIYLQLQFFQLPISKKNKKERYQEELEERLISIVASLFGKLKFWSNFGNNDQALWNIIRDSVTTEFLRILLFLMFGFPYKEKIVE